MQEDIIRLRPHHALCLRHFVGKGYDEAFVENMTAIHRRLNSGQRQMVQIILHRDSLCQACPHDVDYACETEEKVRSGQWLSWQELCDLIDRHMMAHGQMPACCQVCEWFDTCDGLHQK